VGELGSFFEAMHARLPGSRAAVEFSDSRGEEGVVMTGRVVELRPPITWRCSRCDCREVARILPDRWEPLGELVRVIDLAFTEVVRTDTISTSGALCSVCGPKVAVLVQELLS